MIPTATFTEQVHAAEQVLKANPHATNAQLRPAVTSLLQHQNLAVPSGMSNGVFSAARRNLNIVTNKGRPLGSKNRPKVAVAPPSTAISTGNEVIHIGRPAAQVPTLDELLIPIGRMMRERGISSISLSGEGLRVTRQVSEELVF